MNEVMEALTTEARRAATLNSHTYDNGRYFENCVHHPWHSDYLRQLLASRRGSVSPTGCERQRAIPAPYSSHFSGSGNRDPACGSWDRVIQDSKPDPQVHRNHADHSAGFAWPRRFGRINAAHRARLALSD